MNEKKFSQIINDLANITNGKIILVPSFLGARTNTNILLNPINT